jgi:hypothetical protein
MGFRFNRRIRIAPGIRLNVGTRSMSLSFGHRGCWYTTGAHGRRTATLGFPGTGLRYTTTVGGSSRVSPRRPPQPAPSAIKSLMGLALVVIVLLVVVQMALGNG